MAMATITTFFSGCSGNQESLPPDTSSTSTSSDITTGIIDTDGEFSVKFQHWYDSITKQVENNFIDTGKTLLNKIKIDQDSEGNELIMSGRTPIYMLNGKLFPNDFYRNLRVEGTGQRIYSYLETPAEEIEANFKRVLADANATQTTSYEERKADITGNGLALSDNTEYSIYVDNMETDITYRTSDNVIPLYPVLKKLNLV